MGTVQTTTSTPTLAAATAPAAKTDSAAQASDRFLTLLVSQLRNQDPLNPLDNAQVTTQLAQISTVSGINQLNDTVAALAAQFGATQSLQAASLVGHDVLVPGSKLQLADSKGGGGVNLSDNADHVTVSISDASGKVVRTLDLGALSAGVQTFGWDGRSDAGTPAPNGAYSFSVTAIGNGKSISGDALMLGHVDGVIPGANGTATQLQLGRLGRFDLAQA